MCSLDVYNTLMPLILKLFYSGMLNCRRGLIPVIAFLPSTACSEIFTDNKIFGVSKLHVTCFALACSYWFVMFSKLIYARVCLLPYPISHSVEMSSVVHLVPILPFPSHPHLLCTSAPTASLMPEQNAVEEVRLAYLKTEAEIC